jgi:hypothetical protein
MSYGLSNIIVPNLRNSKLTDQFNFNKLGFRGAFTLARLSLFLLTDEDGNAIEDADFPQTYWVTTEPGEDQNDD